MTELLLVNPRKKRRGKRRGPRKMSALQRKYFGGGRRKSRRRSRAVAASSRPARAVGRRVKRRRSGRRRSFISNTSGALSLKPNVFIKQTLIPSAIGGAGALLVDVAWAAIPGIPANLKTGPLAPFVKAAGAVAVGLVASKVAGKKIGGQVVSGYLTVFAYNMLKGVVQRALPNVPMGEYDLGWVQPGAFVPQIPDQNVGAYLEAPTAGGGVGAYLNEYENGYEGNYA